MDLERIVNKKILIRLTESQDGFVSTVRYGPLFRRSKNWAVTSQEEAVGGAGALDSSGSEEASAE
jgi:hypothetical protein